MLNKIGKYEVSEQIGVGGFGAVYRGRDPFIKRTVAIKTCQVNDEEIKHRFFREAELAGNLHHRNITTIYDFGVENGIPYIVQEFLTGEDLDKKIKRGEPIPVARKVEILMAIAEGLGYAHAASIIHRDVKPANVRILEDGTVKVMDFGIAKSLQTESNLTQTGITLGTSAYLAPEQIRGESIDRRTDVFAMGVLSYELICFRKPFRGEHLSTILYKILNETPEPIETLAPDVPPALIAAINRALAKAPGDRYPTMEEFRKDLQAVYRELAGASGMYKVTQVLPDTARAMRDAAPDEDPTLATPSAGLPPFNITPPSGALARVPAPDETPTSASISGGARPPLELVNFRDPSAEGVGRRDGGRRPALDRNGAGRAQQDPPHRARRAPHPRRRRSGGLPPAESRARGPEAGARARARGGAQPRGGADGGGGVPRPQARRGRDGPGRARRADPCPRAAAHGRRRGAGPSRRAGEARGPPEIQDTVLLRAGGDALDRRQGRLVPPSPRAACSSTRESTPSASKPRASPPTRRSSRSGPKSDDRIHYQFPVSMLVIEAPGWDGASVLIDGKFKGILPGAARQKLAAGSYTVTLSREGMNPVTEKIAVPDGAPKTWTPPPPSAASGGAS